LSRLPGAPGAHRESDGALCGVYQREEDGQAAHGVSRERVGAVGYSEAGDSMERGETAEPDGGVILVAMAVCTLIAFVTGVVVGYGAALVLR
jgi:hypothetical protein